MLEQNWIVGTAGEKGHIERACKSKRITNSKREPQPPKRAGKKKAVYNVTIVRNLSLQILPSFLKDTEFNIYGLLHITPLLTD